MTEAVSLTDEERAQDERINNAMAASDFELQELLDLMFGDEDQAIDAGFGVTLALPTGVMSGIAIPHAAWSRRLNGILKDSGAVKLAEARERISEDFEPKRKEVRAVREAEGRPLPPRMFIHLKDLELQSGGEKFQLKNARVKLTDVSAWELGSWTTPPVE